MSDRAAVQKVFDWQYQNTGSFFNLLFLMFQKADVENRAKLASAFPAEYDAFTEWQEAGDYGNDLFRRYGLMS